MRAAADDTITNRQGSLWCGAGAVSAASIARETAAGSTGCGGERADRAPGGQHVGRAEPEHVLARHPDERPRARAVVVGDEGGEPPHERDRQLQRLALDQVAGGGDLVRHRRHGDLEGVAERVLLAPVVAHRQHPGRADRGVGLAGPPRAAHGVGDHHADASPRAARAAPCAAAGRTRRDPRAAARPCRGRCWTRRPRPPPSPARAWSPRSSSRRAWPPPGRSRPRSRRRATSPRPGPRPC